MNIVDNKLYMFATGRPIILSPSIHNYNISTNDYVYFRITYKQSIVGFAAPRLYFGGGVQLFSTFTNDTNENTFSSKEQALENYSYTTFFNYVDNGNNVWIDNYYNINMTSLGISHLTVEEMDYYYKIYNQIINDWSNN